MSGPIAEPSTSFSTPEAANDVHVPPAGNAAAAASSQKGKEAPAKNALVELREIVRRMGDKENVLADKLVNFIIMTHSRDQVANMNGRELSNAFRRFMRLPEHHNVKFQLDNRIVLNNLRFAIRRVRGGFAADEGIAQAGAAGLSQTVTALLGLGTAGPEIAVNGAIAGVRFVGGRIDIWRERTYLSRKKAADDAMDVFERCVREAAGNKNSALTPGGRLDLVAGAARNAQASAAKYASTIVSAHKTGLISQRDAKDSVNDLSARFKDAMNALAENQDFKDQGSQIRLRKMAEDFAKAMSILIEKILRKLGMLGKSASSLPTPTPTPSFSA